MLIASLLYRALDGTLVSSTAVADWIPLRLRPLLGPGLDAVSSQTLPNLLGVPEDVDLDFKQEVPGTSDAATKEFAYDVAGFANAVGGLLVFGIAEDGAGNAGALSPVPRTDRDFGLWVHQVVAARIAPPPRVTHRVFEDGGQIHIVAVEPSVVGPHAVNTGDSALRYPARVGNTRRFLAEAEVADRYRRRFVELGALAGQLDELLTEAEQMIPDDEIPAEGGDRKAWLSLALVPDVSGRLDLRRGLATTWKEWLNPALDLGFPCFGRSSVVNVFTGFQCLELNDGTYGSGVPRLVGGRLYLDGRGMLIIGYLGGRGSAGIPNGTIGIFDEYVVGDLVNGIGVLASHASRCGASGIVHLAAQLSGAGDMVLAESRSNDPGILEDTRLVVRSTGRSRRSVPLDATASPSSDRIAATRLLALDLFSAFGLPEPQQITNELRLVRRKFQSAWQPRMEEWASKAQVEVIENYSS